MPHRHLSWALLRAEGQDSANGKTTPAIWWCFISREYQASSGAETGGLYAYMYAYPNTKTIKPLNTMN
jgi:hypothetical protein